MISLKRFFLASLVAVSSTGAGAETVDKAGSPSGLQTYADFENAEEGLRDVIFSFDLSQVDHEYSWQFGGYFQFGNERSDMAYIAIQPYEKIIRVSFYSFTPGAQSTSPIQKIEDGNWKVGCTDTADGFRGVSCHNFFEMDNYDDLFNLSVTNQGGNTWAGKYINTATGQELPVGEWTLPHPKPIKPTMGYFLEALTGQESCTNIPGTVTTLFPPFSASKGQQATFKNSIRTGACNQTIQAEERILGMGRELTVQGGSKRSKTTPATSASDPPSAQPQKEPEASQPEAPDNQPPQQPATGPSHLGEEGPTGEQSVPWQTEAQYQALCRGYNGDAQACIGGYEQCQQDLSGYAVVRWYDLVRCVNRLEKSS